MRLWAAIKTDALLQARNALYAISIAVSIIGAAALSWLSPPDYLAGTVPMAILMFVGGSTLLYVVAMVILEKDDGTLHAVTVSPLRAWEYLASKVTTLTALATLEGVLLCGGALALIAISDDVSLPNLLFLVGLVALAVMHVLVGVLLVVRYDRIMEALLPMSAVASLMQLPAFYFVGALDHPAVLVIPTAAPTMFIRGAFTALEPWEWAYGVVVTTLCLGLLAVWAHAAFRAYTSDRMV